VSSASRWIAALAYAGAAFLFGLALGERGELGVVQHVFTLVIPLATIVLATFARRNRVHTFATGLAILTGLLIGQRQFAAAWDDCVIRGESVRAALLRLDEYPTRLEELPIALPCKCGFRSTILHYMSNERAFRLWMTNDRETFVGTDKIAFTPNGKSSAPRSR
jgi:hypothetical protein